MRNIAPRLVGTLVNVAEDQPEYEPVVVLPASHPDFPVMPWAEHNAIIMCFEPTADDRQRIINGENLYISLLVGDEKQQPIMLSIGPEEMAQRYGLQVKERALNVPDDVSACHSTCLVAELEIGDRFKDPTHNEWLPVLELRNNVLNQRYIEIRVSENGRGLTYNKTIEVEVIKP